MAAPAMETWLAAFIAALPWLIAALFGLCRLAAGPAAARSMISALIDSLSPINRAAGRAVAWLALVMVLAQFAAVVMRYVFGVNFIWLQESVLYAFGFLFMLTAGYTLAQDGHVRVDILYRGLSPKGKAAVDLAGTAFLLMPTVALIVWVSLDYVAASWAVKEGSKETSGLPFIYLLKTAIPLFSALLALEGTLVAARSLRVLSGGTATAHGAQAAP